MVDGLDHAVTDEQFAAGRRERLGRYESVCGHVVDVAPMLWSPGEPCSRCRLFLAARASLRTAEQRLVPHSHRKPGLWRRLLDRLSAPAVAATAVPAGRHHLRDD